MEILWGLYDVVLETGLKSKGKEARRVSTPRCQVMSTWNVAVNTERRGGGGGGGGGGADRESGEGGRQGEGQTDTARGEKEVLWSPTAG